MFIAFASSLFFLFGEEFWLCFELVGQIAEVVIWPVHFYNTGVSRDTANLEHGDLPFEQALRRLQMDYQSDHVTWHVI